MPSGDQTGPMGQGRLTGRRMGYCAGYNSSGNANPSFGRGFGSGFGRGFRRCFGFERFAYSREPVQYSKEDELAGLKSEKEAIEKRIREIEKED